MLASLRAKAGGGWRYCSRVSAVPLFQSPSLAAHAGFRRGLVHWGAAFQRSPLVRLGGVCALERSPTQTGTTRPPQLGGLPSLCLGSVRQKQVKKQSYRKDGNSFPCGQKMPQKAHIGVKALSAEYCEAGRLICKQRKFISKNTNVKRNRHFKIYPGENVKVMKSTSLQAACSGRVKMTHDVTRDVKIMNILPEPREELLRDDLWRYRSEHVTCMEENRLICSLRAKALTTFGKEGGWINQPVGVKPMRVKISHRNDEWNNPMVQDPLEIEPYAYPLPRSVLARHIRKVRRRQAGVPDSENDPDFHVKDPHFHKFRGQSAQR